MKASPHQTLPRLIALSKRMLRLLAWFVLPIAAVIGALQLSSVKREMGARIGEIASDHTGLHVTCESASLVWLGIQLSNVEVERRDNLGIKFQSLRISPYLVPLLSKQIRLKSVVGIGFTVILPTADENPYLASFVPSENAQVPSGDSSPTPPLGPKPTPPDKRPVIARIVSMLGTEPISIALDEGQLSWRNDDGAIFSLPIDSVKTIINAASDRPFDTTVHFAPVEGAGGFSVRTTLPGKTPALLQVRGVGLPLNLLRPHLDVLLPTALSEKVTPWLEGIDTLPTVGGNFSVEFVNGLSELEIKGQLVLADLYFDHERIALGPFGPINLSQDVLIRVDLAERQLEILKWVGKVNKATYQLLASVHDMTDAFNVLLSMELIQVPYQDLLDSIPADHKGTLEGVKLGGSLDLKAHLEGDLRKPDNLKTEWSGDWRRLRLEEPSEPLRGTDPLHGFLYIPYSRDGVRRTFFLGRDQPGWVRFDQVPPYLVSALLASEDINFYQHEGFDEEGLRHAILTNIKAGRTVRGGSTITQQLAKNLFLTPERTLIRKLLEAVLTWELEQVLKKQQILEHYLNIIEWGPGIYGITRAAEHYFGKSPIELSVKEAAFLCSIIPNPVRYHSYFIRGTLTDVWARHVQNLIDRLRMFESISEEQYQMASEERLTFRYIPRQPLQPEPEVEDDADFEAEDFGLGDLLRPPRAKENAEEVPLGETP